MGFYFSTIIFYRKLILINSVLLIFIELIIYANITPVFYEKAVGVEPRNKFIAKLRSLPII